MLRFLRFACALGLILPVLPPALAQQKHPFTFEDLMKLKRVAEPVPSPDGKWVIFSVVDVDLAANTKTPHIWIVPLTGEGAAASQAIPERSQKVQAEQGSAAISSTPERILISGQDADRPRWSPDGKRFAFISNKSGSSQVWIADFDGSAGAVVSVHQLTDIATEAAGELWSPDGQNILFTSDVYPECDGAPADESACNARKLKEAQDSKVKALVFDRLLYRHWTALKAGKRSHIFIVSADCQGTAAARPSSSACPATSASDLTPGDFDSPVFSLGGQDDYAFSPDGKEICFTSNHDKVEATSTNNDLWIVPVAGGAAKNITADNPASDSSPLYSPDGKYIAYRAQQRPGYESDRFRLMLYDRKTGEKKNLTEGFDRWVGTYAWAPSSVRLFFSAEDKGQSPIYTIEAEPVGTEGQPQEVLNGYNDDIAVTRDYALFFTRMSLQAPSEIWFLKDVPDPKLSECNLHPESLPAKQRKKNADACSARGKRQVEQLTHSNDSVFSQVQMQPLESFWFPGANGDKVQGFIVCPPNFDPNKKYPLKFIIHGGPEVPMGDQWSYRWNMQLFAASGYVVIFINFHGSPGYGQKFIDVINGDWGGAPFEDLMKGLDYAEQHYPFIDKDRECAMGASYGGWMANWILGHTDRFKCIVSHDSMFNTTSAWGSTEELWFPEWEFKGTPYTNRAMYDKWSPHLYADKFKTPTLVIHGQKDYRLDVSEGFQLFTTLQRMGVPSKMLYFPDEGHWVLKPQNSQLWYKTVNDWVDQWIGTK